MEKNNKTLCFLSGIKYSGEHLLFTILMQNKKLFIDFESDLFNKYVYLVQNIKNKDDKIFSDLFDAYLNSKTAQNILNHCYGWSNSEILNECKSLISANKKHILIVDEPTECAAFIVNKYKPNDLYTFLKTNHEISQLKTSYALSKNIYNESTNNDLLIINGKDIYNNIKSVINKIHDYLEIDNFEYDYSYFEFVEELNSKNILGEFYDDFDVETFWDLEYQSKKPIKDLDLQLKYALMGEFEKSIELVNKIEKEKPSSNRAAFNRAWFKIRDGKLLEGHQLLDRGRLEGVFGNPLPKTQKPVWDAKSEGKVLYILEGGYGDQIHGLRYAEKIKNISKNVVIACSPELMEFVYKNGYSDVVSNNNISDNTVMFDYWVPSMSAVSFFEYEYKDICGKPYIKKLPRENNSKFRIGLKWSGNPKFEHEQFRKFPSNLFFDSVYINNENIEYVSLQRDEEKDIKPNWVKDVCLNSWLDTQREISNCDLVISSCTSVAHLAGAMGVQTWIILPILPYYLWALPGEKTPYYDSVTLFRQNQYQNWTGVFENLKEKIIKYI